MREALRRDGNGNFVYSTILWADIKKSIKSTIAAAVALWVAWNREWGSVKIVANDLKQADSRSAYYARRSIELNPVMAEEARVKPSGYFIELPNRAKIEAIPVDPKGEAGGNDDAVFYSELWAANNVAAKKLWTETTLSPTKYGQSFRWIETYAGFVGESPILEKLYNSGLAGRKIDLSYEGHDLSDLNVWSNPAARLFMLWNQTPRLSWQTPEYYAQEEATLDPSEFRRVHRNEWVQSENSFVAEEWWDACAGTPPPVNKDESMIIALDAAVSGDSFSLVMVGGGQAVKRDVIVRYARRWKPPLGGKIVFNAPDGPGAELRRLIREYNVIEICYDPYQLEFEVQDIKRDLSARFHAFNQTNDRLLADKGLQSMIREKRLMHSGEHDLAEHVKNANAKNEGDNKLRIVKRTEDKKIDLAVGLSMASARALYWRI